MLSKIILIILSGVISLSNVATPLKIVENLKPQLSAKSALIYDINSQTISYSKNAYQKLPIASLTKLMTVYIATQEHDMQEVVKLSPQHKSVGGSSANLQANDSYYMQDLIHAMLLSSANEAAAAVAEHSAGSQKEFVKKMNHYAKKLGLKNTKFANPMGFDHIDNYSTAYDLAKFTKTLMENNYIVDIAKKQNYKITSLKKKNTLVKNTNKELENKLNLSGLKTGTTPLAGQCFIGISDGPKSVMTIVLNSKNRFLDTNSLLEYNSNKNFYDHSSSQ